MEPRTCEGWLIWLDQQRPTDEHWQDAGYVQHISWVMLMTVMRRCAQMLIDAGEAQDSRPEYR